MSPKLDGIRCTVVNGVPLTTSKKPIPNLHIREALSKNSLSGFDGELIAGSPCEGDVIGRTQSLVMSHSKVGNWTFYVFDNFMLSGDFYHRTDQLQDLCGYPQITPLEHFTARNEDDVRMLDKEFVEMGYEGSILRDPRSDYLFGRCTPRTATMIKMKSYVDEEAIIVGFEERMHNANALEIDPVTGRKFRSSAGGCDVGLGVLGAFILKHPKTGLEFKCGSGLDLDQAAIYWRERQSLLGKIVTYKTMVYGTKDRPRHPIFKYIRDERDISDRNLLAPQQGKLL